MMSLIDIKKYLMQVKIVSLASISVYFNVEPNLMRDMLNHWIRKGCVKQCLRTNSCGTKCVKCKPELTEIYEWLAH